MKNILLLFLSLIGFYMATGQTVPSNCSDGADSVVKAYRTDAQRLTLSRILTLGVTYKDSAQIPEAWTDTVLRALLAVYNAPLPASDTVTVMYKIHTRDLPDTTYPGLNLLTMDVDPSQQWTMDIGNSTTISDSTVAALMNKYDMYVVGYYSILPDNYVLTLHSDSNWNTYAIGKQWLNIPGVFEILSNTEWNGNGGGGDHIFDTIESDYIALRYIHAWGDCPAGCTHERNWLFHISYDCAVTYEGSWGDPLPDLSVNAVDRHNVTVYPNPARNEIDINTPAPDISYRLMNVTGVSVAKGRLQMGNNKLLLSGFAPGLYILEMNGSDGERHVVRIVKE